ncbi:MAG: enoyl-CoA hydratase/isomerase family protein [Ketobacter sp.]
MTESVLFSELSATNGKKVGVATLNMERKLNSLNSEMVSALTDQLKLWEKDNNVAAVWLQGAGEKAFCAGGDVRTLCETITDVGAKKALPDVQAFFENEYRLDYLIHVYAKPIIVWGHGIIMGGGIGLMSGASHRVVTETSRMAMPEISIGLYPDVGGTWFLNHAPGRTGLFLGLTGANINAADALFVGMADRYIASDSKEELMQSLQEQSWSESEADNQVLVSRVLKSYENLETLPVSNVREHYDLIQAVTDGADLVEIADQFNALDTENKWLNKAAATFRSGSPTTAHLVYQQLLRGKKLSLPQVFQMELVMSLQCALHADFVEGVRALLVDKDGNPKWQFDAIADVPAKWVEQHFQPPWDAPNPLLNLGS